jgi:hypothetical protein
VTGITEGLLYIKLADRRAAFESVGRFVTPEETAIEIAVFFWDVTTFRK